jgi:hypothetical protein
MFKHSKEDKTPIDKEKDQKPSAKRAVSKQFKNLWAVILLSFRLKR